MIESEAQLQQKNVEYIRDNWYYFLVLGMVAVEDIVRLEE